MPRRARRNAGCGRDVGALQLDAAAHAVDQADDGLEQGGLADTVAAEDGGDAAIGNVHRDAVQCVAAAVETVDLAQHRAFRLPSR